MNNSSEEYHFFKKDKRRISDFFAVEFLYDFMGSKLDSSRSKAVAQAISEDSEIQLQLEKLKLAESYLIQFRNTEVSDFVAKEIYEKKGYFELLIEKLQMESWPKPIKLALESLIVVVMMISVLTITPWDKISKWVSKKTQNEIILTEIEKKKQSSAPFEIATNDLTPNLAEDSQRDLIPDQGLEVTEKSLKKTEIQKMTESVKGTEEFSKEAVTKTSSINKPKKVEVLPTEEVATPIQEQNIKTESAVNSKIAVNEGILYRGTLEVTNVEMTGEKIRQKITELGGRKAGNVELAWKKSADSRYYHFTIPESKKEELDSFLQTYNVKFSFSKEKHGRVMPDGIIRIIMTVDEKE